MIDPSTLPIATVSAPPARPTLLYDGDCAFCRRWVARWRYTTGDAVDYEPNQQARSRYPEVPADEFRRRMVLVLPDGNAFGGPAAVFRAFDLAGRRRWLRWAYENVPPFTGATNLVYGFISRHRPLADRLDRFLNGADPTPSTYFITREVFSRGLSLIFLFAFASLWSQVHGLIGSKGILPIDRLFTHEAAAHFGKGVYWHFPTLLWISPTDRMLDILCGGGVTLSIIALIGLFQGPALLLMWAAYLSLSIAGQTFLGYQWDMLLLEAGILGVFFARWSYRPFPRLGGAAPAGLSLFLLRWLLFRLMFRSGVVKLASLDSTWRNWTALKYHYWTQPIPTWTSWYANLLPDRMQKLSVGVMLYIELFVPFLIFAPRRIRRVAFYQLVFLQLLIAGTGNYGFFNLLTIVLCLTLLDDAYFTRWSARWRGTVARLSPAARVSLPRLIIRWLAAPVAALIFLIGIVQGTFGLGLDISWPEPLMSVVEMIEPFRSISAYGLFATMTTTRPELVIEGSRDGRQWVVYPFRWKATDLSKRPTFCTPHLPRLDWQMWFLALDQQDNVSWFVPFLHRLLEGDQTVLALLERDPFNGTPPKYLRVTEYQYKFTTPDERRKTGDWWKRGRGTRVLGPITLDSFSAGSDAAP